MNSSCEYVKVIRLQDLYPNCRSVVGYMWGYVMPIVTLFVIAINSLIVVVLTRPHVRSHTTLILTLIAGMDTLNILFPSISYIYHYTTGRFREYLSYSSCLWTYIFADICVDMFNMMSLWLTVLLAFIRCRCLKSPFKSRDFHSYKYIVIYLLVILILALCVHLPSFFLFQFSPVSVIDENSNITKIACGISERDNSIFKPCIGRKIHLLMETVIDSLIPCVVLVSCNILILMTLRKAKRNRSFLRNSNLSKKRLPRIHVEADDNCSVIDTRNDMELKTCDSSTKNNCSLKSGVRCGLIKESCKENRKQCQRSSSTAKTRREDFRAKDTSFDISFDKLNRESQRTTLFIMIISIMILVHEIPWAAANILYLIKHFRGPLPLNVNGCFSMVIGLWQYLTYPTIFMIYACMSRSFRTELFYILTYCCRKQAPKYSDSNKLLISPCTVRRSFSRECRHEDQEESNSNFDNDSCI